LAHDLRELGMTAGMTVLVRVSLISVGWVCSGPIAVVQALMDVVTPAGAIVLPAMRASNTNPAARVTAGSQRVDPHHSGCHAGL
jgi:aminoglycoside 3-N-acetyltransferase